MIRKGIKNFFKPSIFMVHFSLSLFLAQNRNSSFYLQFALAISPGALLWTHRFASCNTLSYHGTRKRRARPACVLLLSGTSFSPGAVTEESAREVYDDVDAIIRCHGMRDPGIGGFWERILCRHVDLVHISSRKNRGVSQKVTHLIARIIVLTSMANCSRQFLQAFDISNYQQRPWHESTIYFDRCGEVIFHGVA